MARTLAPELLADLGHRQRSLTLAMVAAPGAAALLVCLPVAAGAGGAPG